LKIASWGINVLGHVHILSQSFYVKCDKFWVFDEVVPFQSLRIGERRIPGRKAGSNTRDNDRLRHSWLYLEWNVSLYLSKKGLKSEAGGELKFSAANPGKRSSGVPGLE
jgi:hypothetical protein